MRISPLLFFNFFKVEDRTDGKLVHLDGLNFSRAWGLYRWVITRRYLYVCEKNNHVTPLDDNKAKLMKYFLTTLSNYNTQSIWQVLRSIG